MHGAAPKAGRHRERGIGGQGLHSGSAARGLAACKLACLRQAAITAYILRLHNRLNGWLACAWLYASAWLQGHDELCHQAQPRGVRRRHRARRDEAPADRRGQDLAARCAAGRQRLTRQQYALMLTGLLESMSMLRCEWGGCDVLPYMRHMLLQQLA